MSGGERSRLEARPRVGASRIAFLLRDLAGGGVERNTLRLARAYLARGLAVDLLVERAEGPLLDAVPPQAKLVPLPVGPISRAKLLAFRADPAGLPQLLPAVLLPRRPIGAYDRLPALVRYLRESRPAGLISAFPFQNLLAIAARAAAGASTRIVVTERNAATAVDRRREKWKRRPLPALIRRHYPMADAVVAVSDGLAGQLAERFRLPRQRIITVYNPIVGDELTEAAGQPVDHSWLIGNGGRPPVVLGAGRLSPQKDFATLVRAFARLRAQRPARLIILGAADTPTLTGQRSAELRDLAASLGVADDVDLPGFVSNPMAFMARADLFVLSSAWEGFSNVLAEALACGCPAVSTDCPHGPAEILEHGRHGHLVPIGDDAAMAEAMARTLDRPPDPSALRLRAQAFTVTRAADAYAGLLGIASAMQPTSTGPAPNRSRRSSSVAADAPCAERA